MVYGAKFMAEKTVKNHGGIQSENLGDEKDGNADDLDNGHAGYENNIIAQKALSFKKTGLLLMMAGSILVLIAFR